MYVLICEFEDEEAQSLSTSVAHLLSQLFQMAQYSANALNMGGNPFSLSQDSQMHLGYGMTSTLPYEQKETVPMGYGFGTMGPDM
jgi:hypothetical protein